MFLLLCLNILWNGLGNLAVGDKRGWRFGFVNWVFFVASVFTAGIPCILFFAYCGYQGYLDLHVRMSNLLPQRNQKQKAQRPDETHSRGGEQSRNET
jgi:hypothetical protein